MSKYLPSDSYKQQLSLYSSFNNNLLSGLSQGLNLYSPQEDLLLYKKIDTKPLDNVSFDKINKQIDENNDLYNNAKSTISGGLSGALEGVGDGINKFIVNSLGIDSNEIKTYIGILLLFLIILKKI